MAAKHKPRGKPKAGPGEKVYGPYKGSKQNHGRPIYVIRKADGSTTSTNKARKDYEDSHHRHLRRDQDVDHKDNNRNNDRASNHQVLSHSANVAKEDRHRAGRGPVKKRKKR